MSIVGYGFLYCFDCSHLHYSTTIRTCQLLLLERGIILSSLSKISDFGLCVKIELLKQNRTQKWLEEETTKRTGLFVDSSYMHKILTGKRNAPKIVEAIRDILNIQDEKGA